jgi:hypothetical protein
MLQIAKYLSGTLSALAASSKSLLLQCYLSFGYLWCIVTSKMLSWVKEETSKEHKPAIC